MPTYLETLGTTFSSTDNSVFASYPPLANQVQKLMEGLPPLSVNRPWSIMELTSQLKGKYHKHPATRDVAKALTQLGWKQQRCWNKSGLNRRFWYPPSDEK